MPVNNTIHVITFTPEEWIVSDSNFRYIITMTGKRIKTMNNRQIVTNNE